MKITLLLLLFVGLFSIRKGVSLAGPVRDHPYLLFVGTYTDKTSSKGIYAFDFDPATGKLIPRGLAAQSANPSWVVIHPDGKFAYAANESGKQSMISAFSIDAKAAKLALLNQLPAQGEDPCHLAFDKTGKYLFAANYTSGDVTVFPILPDGKLGAPTANVKDQGALGPNKERQEGPHAHWVGASSDNRFLYVSDLGLDRVLIYNFDASKGTLSPGSATIAPSPGTGPRHVAFSQNHKFAYVLGEMSSAVTVFSMDGRTPQLIQEISALPKEFSGRKEAAEIALDPSGKWLFTSNRGHDSIAVFSVDPVKGTLTRSTILPTGGQEPRHFALDPTGQFLLAENQNSNTIGVFRINPSTGALTQVSQTENVPSPVCLVFLPSR
jgi:6-phosphogluconolactonase